MENLIKVMWLEEDLFIIDKFKEKAKEYDLDLQVFYCWEDAFNALSSNIKGWSAIILNPKCKLGKGDRPKPQKFLPQVFCDITSICVKFDVMIPWYIFTNLNPSVFEDLVVKDRLKYDAEWERPFYSMDEDAEYLFNRVKMQTTSIDRTKIREGVHKSLFDKLSALTSFGFVREDVSTMEDILISLYEGKESKRCNFVNLRKIIENLIKSMINFGLLPNEIKNTMGETNFVGCARLLAGLECKSGSYNYLQQIPIISNVAGSNLLNILNICHGYAHTESTSQVINRKDTNQYLELAQTNNLLYACTLMLADIIIMYYDYLLVNGKNTENLIFWTKSQV